MNDRRHSGKGASCPQENKKKEKKIYNYRKEKPKEKQS
jgi:hypothetical protein